MAQSAPGGRALTLKQATLPFARAPPKRPRLEEPPTPAEPSPPSPSPSQPKPIEIEDDDSAEEIVCEPTINEKILNPYVPLVDLMLKRKLMKKIGPNKKPKLQTESNETDLADDNEENINPHLHPNSINKPCIEVDLLDSENTDVETSDNVGPISDTEDSSSDEGVADAKANNTALDDAHDHQEQNSENSDCAKIDEKHAPTELLTPKRKGNSASSPLSSKKLTPKQVFIFLCSLVFFFFLLCLRLILFIEMLQLERKLESAKKQRQRESERQERERKKQEEKEMKAKVKEEKEAQLKKEKEDREESKRLALKMKECTGNLFLY